jgi:hypothetical protein
VHEFRAHAPSGHSRDEIWAESGQNEWQLSQVGMYGVRGMHGWTHDEQIAEVDCTAGQEGHEREDT